MLGCWESRQQKHLIHILNNLYQYISKISDTPETNVLAFYKPSCVNVGKSKIRIFGANVIHANSRLYSNRLAAEEVSKIVKQLKHQISSNGESLEVKPLDDGLDVLGITFFTNLKDTWNFNIKKLK